MRVRLPPPALRSNVELMNTEYASGVCNIGPDEIRQRRRFGHAGLAVSVLLLVALVALHAPHVWRLFLFFPVAVAATGYLQAAFHFCAGFGMKGVYNFAKVGTVTPVEDPVARSADRRKALLISAGSAAIGLVVAIAAFLL